MSSERSKPSRGELGLFSWCVRFVLKVPPVGHAVSAVRQAGRHLSAPGYAGEEVGPPDPERSSRPAPHRQQRGARNGTGDGQIGRRWAHLNAPVDGIVAAGRSERVLTALAQRDLFLGRWLVFMQRHPLVVMATMGDLALPHNRDTTGEGRLRWLDSNRVTMIAPLLGIPPLAVPVGHHGRVRPGVQIMASRFREDLCLDAGEVIEALKVSSRRFDTLPAAA